MAELRLVASTLLLLPVVMISGQDWWTPGKNIFVEREERLREALLTNYSTQVRPEYKTYVVLSIILTSLNHLNIAGQSMSVNFLLVSMWTDHRLAWNSSDYGGLDSLITAPEDIWTPPLVIENSVHNVGVVGGKERDGTPTRITNNGQVVWSSPTEVTVSCEMLIAHYPFDTQSCTVVVIGWTYPLSELDLVVTQVYTTVYSGNGEFELRNTSTYTTILEGTEWEDTYKKVYFQLTFRRKWPFYVQNLLMPIVLNSILMNVVFLLPIESGEKMGYSLTVLLSYTVFLTWVTENLPPISTDASILQIYLAVVLCLGCVATLLTTWILHLYHKPADQPLSSFYAILAKRILLPLRHCECFCSGKPYQDKMQGRPAHVLPCSGKITPLRSQPAFGGVLSVLDADSHLGKATADMLDRQDGVSANDGAREVSDTAVLTWQELADLMDSVFFWVFVASLLVVTGSQFGYV